MSAGILFFTCDNLLASPQSLQLWPSQEQKGCLFDTKFL